MSSGDFLGFLNQLTPHSIILKRNKIILHHIAPMDSCHLLLGWAWLHFKTLYLDERSIYLRHEGHQKKYKFMTTRQVTKDQRRLKEGENRKRKNRKRSI